MKNEESETPSGNHGRTRRSARRRHHRNAHSVRVVPPTVRADKPRPALNLALVLDRSGSMQGDKLRAAKAAAACAIRALESDDRVSVTIFDDTIETIVPSTLAHDKTVILRELDRVQCGGSTALHAGWVEGGMQVGRHLDMRRLNRVILLTDGLANEGETNPDRICSDVNDRAQRGISTTTMGVATISPKTSSK